MWWWWWWGIFYCAQTLKCVQVFHIVPLTQPSLLFVLLFSLAALAAAATEAAHTGNGNDINSALSNSKHQTYKSLGLHLVLNIPLGRLCCGWVLNLLKIWKVFTLTTWRTTVRYLEGGLLLYICCPTNNVFHKGFCDLVDMCPHKRLALFSKLTTVWMCGVRTCEQMPVVSDRSRRNCLRGAKEGIKDKQ